MKRITNSSQSISLMSISANLSGILPYSNDPKDFSICQILYSPTNRIMIFSASNVNNLNTKQLLELVSSNVGIETELNLFIKFPNNNFLLLEENESPFQITESLFYLPIDKEDKEKLHSYHLIATPKKKTNRSFLLIPVIDEESNFLYMMPFLQTSKSFHLDSILKSIQAIHQCPKSSISVYTKKGQKLNDDMVKLVTIKHVLNQSIYISLTMTKHIHDQIQKRVNVLNELKSTEINFFKTINGFIENVTPVFKKTNILTANELNSFVNAVHYIIGLQERIVSDLKDMRINYMTLIGTWFKEYVPFLKGYNQYLTLYKMCLPKITEAMKLKENKPIFEAFLNSEYSNSLRFDSVLIIPVQHSPRYMLLLREMIKATPEAHPDYEDLVNTFELVDETIQKLNNEVTVFQKKQELMNFESLFSEKVDLFCPNRNYIGYYNAQYKSENYLLLLFSDEIWLSIVNKEGKLKRKKKLSLDDTNVFTYSNKSVVFRSLSQPLDFIYLFEDTEKRDKFVSDFRKTTVSYLKLLRDQIRLRYETVDVKNQYKLSDHSMAFLNGTFYVFGGRDEDGNATNGLYKFTAENPLFEELHVNKDYSKPPPRFMSAFCAIDTGLFVFGGTNDEKSGFSDFWFYSFKFERWQQLLNEDENDSCSPPGGYGLELKLAKLNGKSDSLILSGGNDQFGIYAYKLKTKVWEKIEPKNGLKIQSLYGHSMIPISQKNDNFLIIGGKNSEGEYNRFPLFVTNDCQTIYPVNLTRINPIERFQHRSVVIDKTVYIIGGDSTEKMPFALHLNLSLFTVPKVEGEKKHAVRGFAMATDGKDIYMHGGFDKKGKLMSCLMKISVFNPESENDKNLNFVDQLSEASFERDNLAYQVMNNPKSVSDGTWIVDQK